MNQGKHKIKHYWQAHTDFRLSSLFLLVYLLCALLADILPLPYDPNHLDFTHLYLPPFGMESPAGNSSSHWLGTDGLGRDVLANVVYGCRTSFLISFTAMGLATALGLVLGSLAGFCGDRCIRVSYPSLLFFSFALAAAWFYGLYRRQYLLADAAAASSAAFSFEIAKCLAIMSFFGILAYGLRLVWSRLNGSGQSFYLPVDQLVLKSIEIISVIPRLILILCLTAFAYPSLPALILLISLTYWAGPARLVRAELLKVTSLAYVQAAEALGLPPGLVFRRYALANSLGSVAVAFTFGVTSLLALESTLSFLGIGIPAELASWGRLMAGIRLNLSAWWLVLIPGGFLSLTVLSLQTCSHYLQKAFLTPGP